MQVAFNLKVKDFIVQVAKRIKKTEEALPRHTVCDSVKFSWCSGWESEKNHLACKIEFFDKIANRQYNCACECHKEKNVKQ